MGPPRQLVRVLFILMAGTAFALILALTSPLPIGAAVPAGYLAAIVVMVFDYYKNGAL